jgi:dihydrolipoamide dehydrogenase
MRKFDVIVIGGGPAGYAAAIRAAQLGMNVACIDERVDAAGKPALGGTCLNVGCIPSKVLLEASSIYELSRQRYPRWGITAGEAKLDLAAMMAHKQGVVERMTQGIGTLFQANGVRSLTGRGCLLSNREVEFSPAGDGDPVTLEAENIVLAAGSRPVEIGAAPLQSDIIVDSTGALGFTEVPKRLGVIGAGVIGLELGSVWRRLGSEVVLFEAQTEFLSACDRPIAREALRVFRAQGLDIRLGARVTDCVVSGGAVDLEYQDEHGQSRAEHFDRLIVAVGRQPNSDGLCAPETGLLLDEWGFVHVDRHCMTNLPGVHAVGDLVRGPMLAHKGAQEGVMVIERIAGHETAVNYDTIPSVIYTLPEIAWAGATEQGLIATGTAYRVGTFPFAANGRAHANGETVGMVRILADADTDRVLGVHMIGPGCSELIAIAVVAMEFGASSEDLALTMFAHPTLSEALHEAALGVHGRPIHIARRKN